MRQLRWALLAKMDHKEAYCAVPVHPADRPLLTVEWRGTGWSFTFRPAPKIFSALADGLLWFFLHNGVHQAIHYLYDSLFLGPPASQVCTHSLHRVLRLRDTLGVPVTRKNTGPCNYYHIPRDRDRHDPSR